jgi:copper chaperone
MTTMTISVPEIHCDHCKHSIEGALAPLPGVASARVDIEARTVTVQVDETLTDRGHLVAAIEDQGYDVPA